MFFKYTAFLLFGCAFATAQPTVDPLTIMNAGGTITPEYPNGGISRGGSFILKGAGLGACGVVTATSFPIKTSMGGTSVKINAGGQSVDGLMIYVVACQNTLSVNTDQLCVILPSNTPLGPATLTVTYNGKTSASVPFNVVDRQFGFLALNSNGTGPGIFQNFDSATGAEPLNTLASSAKPGQTVIGWGTGLGPDGNPDANAPVPTNINTGLKLWVGGELANVAYSGRSGCCSGFDQIVFTVPNDVTGCYVPVVAQIGSAVSNFVTLSVDGNGGACTDPFGIGPADIQKAAAQGKFNLGVLTLNRVENETPLTGNLASVSGFDEGQQQFEQLTYLGFLGLTARDISQPGSCTVIRDTNNLLAEDTPPILISPGTLPQSDAGDISVNGPKGSQIMAPSTTTAWAQLAGIDMGSGATLSTGTFLEPGSYSLNAPGGAEQFQVGAFNTSITLPAVVNFTNRLTLSSNIDRTQPLTVNWTGADPNGYVQIRGMSITPDNVGAVASFYCLARGSANSFTVPDYVLRSLPVSSPQQSLNFLIVGIGVSQFGATRFSATGLDGGILKYYVTIGRSVAFQ